MYRKLMRIIVTVLLLALFPSLVQAAPGDLLPGVPAPHLRGEMPMRTYSLDFYRLPGGLDAQVIRQMSLAVEGAITNGSTQINSGLSGRVSIRFEPPQSGECAIRGLTLSDQRTIRLFYAPGTDPQRIVSILSHELFHQLQHDYYGERDHLKADNLLLEGMATWGSRAYFRNADGQPTYQAEVKRALRDGALIPLTINLVADCRTTTRVNIYNEWASFVEYLLTTYGRERFDTLYRSSTGRAAGSANYRGVYGKTLDQLDADWRVWLAGQG